MSEASTSDESVEDQRPQIKVPSNKAENRLLKEGHCEDDNSDIAYFNFRLLWPTLFISVMAMMSFILAIAISLHTDQVPSRQALRRGFIVRYGASRFACNSTIPMPRVALPSILNLFELNVFGNVFFRLAACLPMAVRIFNAFTLKSIISVESDASSRFHLFLNDLVPVLTAVEVVAMALFSIITVHSDFPEANRYCKVVFGIAAGINMILTTALTFSYGKDSEEKLDSLSIAVKLLACSVFCYLAPQYFQHHHAHIRYPMCHSFLPRIFALMEYGMIVAYAAFHLTILIDIRDVTFLCYPRTCGGECEPLDPANFEKGAKFEHCRAFEYNQRKMLEL